MASSASSASEDLQLEPEEGLQSESGSEELQPCSDSSISDEPLSHGLLDVLNGHRFDRQMSQSPLKGAVFALGHVLAQHDPMGLMGFPGIPRNEYHPEAVEYLCIMLDALSRDDLFQLSQEQIRQCRAHWTKALSALAIKDALESMFATECPPCFELGAKLLAALEESLPRSE